MTDDDWKYPWPKPANVYENNGPAPEKDGAFGRLPRRFLIDGIELEIAPTERTGLYSGRISYAVACVTCGVVLHEATSGASYAFDNHLKEKHGVTKARRGEWGAGSSAPSPTAPAPPPAKRIEHQIASADGPGGDWRMLLECTRPGVTHLVLERSVGRLARIPIENILQGHLIVDAGADAGEQRQIAALRHKVGDLETQIVDQKVVKLELREAEKALAAATSAKAAAESELAHLRQTLGPTDDALETQAKLTTLLSGARSMLQRCPRCNGSGAVDRMPCPYCGVFRELVSVMTSPMERAIRGMWDNRVRAAADVRARNAADLERGQVALEGNRQERLAELDRLHVFMLHPGVGAAGPYWELGSERDPEVKRLRSGGMYVGVNRDNYGPLPPAFLNGLFMALEPGGGGGYVFSEATQFVEIDRERGLAAVPEHLRADYQALAEGRW